MLHFKNFVLDISRPNEDYVIRLLESPMGNAAILVDSNSFSRLEEKIKKFYEIYRDFIKNESKGLVSNNKLEGNKAISITINNLIGRYGAKLFDLIIDGEIRRSFDKSYGIACASDTILRLLIQTDLKEWSNLSLEILYDKGMPYSGDKFLCLGQKTVLARYHPPKDQDMPPITSRSLKVLVVIADPKDKPLISKQAEQYSLTKTIQNKAQLPLRILGLSPSIKIKYLNNATYSQLESDIREFTPNVIHFVGHAGLRNENFGVFLEDIDGKSDFITGWRLLRLFRNPDNVLSFIFLNACQSYDICQQIVKKYGIAMVVGTKHPVYDEVAIHFMAEFYSHLLNGNPADYAMREAREKTLSVNEHQWSIYTLAMQTQTGQLFDYAIAPELKEKLRDVWLHINNLATDKQDLFEYSISSLTILGKSIVGFLVMLLEEAAKLLLTRPLEQTKGILRVLGNIMVDTNDRLPIEPLSNFVREPIKPLELRQEAFESLAKCNNEDIRAELKRIWFDPLFQDIKNMIFRNGYDNVSPRMICSNGKSPVDNKLNP